MSPVHPRTRDNPETAMVHAPSAAFFDKPNDWHRAIGEHLARRGLDAIQARNAELAGTVPGFNSEAHRAFMRSLG
jgi:hypothetical protein